MINWQRITELRDEVGDDDFFEVVDLFLEEVDEVISRLKSMPDPSRFEQDMHFLKGSALNLGFNALASKCATYENSAASGNAQEVDPAEVIAIYESSKSEIRESFRTLEAA